jgi:hypothetical protein
MGYQSVNGSEFIGLCWMTNPEKPNENIFIHIILLTPEGTAHLLLSLPDGAPFLFKGKHDLISLVGYSCDPAILADTSLNVARQFFQNFGPYGEIAILQDPSKKLRWIDGDDEPGDNSLLLPPLGNGGDNIDTGLEFSFLNDNDHQEAMIGGINRSFVLITDETRIRGVTNRFYTSPLIAQVISLPE